MAENKTGQTAYRDSRSGQFAPMRQSAHHLAPQPTTLSMVPMPDGPAIALVHDGQPSIAISADDEMIWLGVRKGIAKPLLTLGAAFALGYVAAEFVDQWASRPRNRRRSYR